MDVFDAQACSVVQTKSRLSLKTLVQSDREKHYIYSDVVTFCAAQFMYVRRTKTMEVALKQGHARGCRDRDPMERSWTLRARGRNAKVPSPCNVSHRPRSRMLERRAYANTLKVPRPSEVQVKSMQFRPSQDLLRKFPFPSTWQLLARWAGPTISQRIAYTTTHLLFSGILDRDSRRGPTRPRQQRSYCNSKVYQKVRLVRSALIIHG